MYVGDDGCVVCVGELIEYVCIVDVVDVVFCGLCEWFVLVVVVDGIYDECGVGCV